MNSTSTPPSLSHELDAALWEASRTLLPHAVLARPTDDTVDLHTWVCIAEALEASAHVIACHADGGQQSVLDVLTGFASKQAARACAAVPGPGRVPSVEQVRSSQGAVRALERTWLRVAAQLVRPGQADVELLSVSLQAHLSALAALRPR